MRHLDYPQSLRRGTARTPRILASGLGAAVLIGGAAVAPAQARPIESGAFSVPVTETIECGNRSLELDATIVGTYVIKDSTPKTGGQFFKFSQAAEFNGTFTDPDPVTGGTFTEYWRTNFREGPGTIISEDGQIAKYQTKESGIWDVFRDSSGKVAYRNTGTVVTDWTADTHGDGVPGATVLSEEFVRTSGHFPTFDTDICQIAESILG
jgi:hypothetical protein